MTILFGENGTGKTGYARIFKAIAGSRTADEVILGDITEDEGLSRDEACIAYTLGTESKEFVWTGEHGVAPFIRMSIFDSPSSNYINDDLEYVYVPTVLSLFNHVISGIKSVQGHIENTISELSTSASTLLSRFPRNSGVSADRDAGRLYRPRRTKGASRMRTSGSTNVSTFFVEQLPR